MVFQDAAKFPDGLVEKAAQLTPLARLEAPRQSQQLVHVGHALIGRVEATHVRLIATPVQRPLDQARDRAGGSDAPLTREPLAEAGEALAVAIAQARAQLLNAMQDDGTPA